MIKLDLAHKSFIKHLEDNNKSSSTVIAYSKDIEQLILYLASKDVELVSDIELTHLEEYMQKLATEQYTPKSISRKTNATKTFFKYLKDIGHVTKNVAEMLRHPKVDIKAPRILSKTEYRALRDAAKNDIRTSAIIEVLLQTGVTISELAEIELEHLDLEKDPGTLYIPKKNNKDARIIPLNKAVVATIKSYKDSERSKISSGSFLFVTKSGNPLLVRNIRSTIERYYKLAGVESAKVNDLRHTFIAHHLSQGTSLLHISKIAGHKRLSTTERYLQYVEIVTKEEKTELGVL